MDEYEGPERRIYGTLSKEEVDSIKEQILASIYEDIGRSLVKRILWVVGISMLALFGWLASSGKIPLGK